MPVQTYDARAVAVSVADRPIRGFADGTYVSAAPLSNSFESYVGSDGRVSRAATNDARVLVTLSLAQTSEGNDVLSQLAALDRLAPNGAGVGQFVLSDTRGTTRLVGPCWIEQMPTIELGREIAARAWNLLVHAQIWVVGGNL